MSGSSLPCAACRLQKKRCVEECIFAPYFHYEDIALFADIHRVFGAHHASKILAQVPVSERYTASMTILYEARARLLDPVYGCVSQILAFQQQVTDLQAQVDLLREQLDQAWLGPQFHPNFPIIPSTSTHEGNLDTSINPPLSHGNFPTSLDAVVLPSSLEDAPLTMSSNNTQAQNRNEST